MSGKQCPEDVAAFKRIIEADPENKKCFECGYPHPLWCNINHGVFICMECSGVHRGLGVHLSFVRSATIDDWTAWRPEKLRQMEIGGNRKARLFFDQLGVPKQPIRARYEHNGALMYKDKLEAEAQGKPFNEATWQVPEWKQRMASGANMASPNGGSASTNRFQGMGSAGSNTANNGGGGGDWFGALSDGWGKVASATSELAAATTKSVKESQVQDKASETASWAWGNLTSYASAIGKMATDSTAALTTAVAGGVSGGGDDDGLGGLTRNVQRTSGSPNDDRFKGIEHRGAPVASRYDDDDGLGALTRNVAKTSPSDAAGSSASNERFKGYEHRAERRANENSDGWGNNDGWGDSSSATTDLRGLAGALPRNSKYEGIGSSPQGSPNATLRAAGSSPKPATTTVEKSNVAAAPSPSAKKAGWDDWDNNDDFE